MARYIDADELRELIDGGYDLDFDELPETKQALLKMIDEQPTADVREVVHGHWIDTSPPPVDEGRLPEWIEYTCSACGKGHVIAMTPYCYMCGAKMDGNA